MRFLLAALLWLITFGTVDVASAETPEELTRQCQKGNAGACVTLGLMYAGTGVTQDAVKAVELFRKACEGQQAGGCGNLGYMYGTGTGVTQDAVKAVDLYRQACDGQHANGCNNLGWMYANGTGVQQSDDEARKFYDKGCKLGYKDACTQYAKLVPQGKMPRATPPPVPSQAPSEVKSKNGSGFVVSQEGHIVTNHHVVEGCSRLEGTIQGESQPLTVIQIDHHNDLALLKMKTAPSAVASFRDGVKIRAGDSVVAMGFPLHGLLSPEANVTAGVVSSMTGIGGDSGRLQITAPIQPGNSGGPLMDLSGNVIGIVVAQLDALKVGKVTGSIPQNVNFAISSTIARAFLDSIGINYRTSNANRPLETADVAELGRKFTSLIQCFN